MKKNNITNQIDISVVVPTYNPDEYILYCLKSILNNIVEGVRAEVIVIYNGQKNSFHPRIEAFCQKHKNFKLLYTEVKGVSNARNLGLEVSVGQYITFIDDDDWVSENYLQSLLAESKKNTVVVSNVVTYQEDTKSYGKDYLGQAFDNLKNESYNIFKYRKFMSSSCCKLIPKDCIQNITFDKSLKLAEDSVFMFSISENVENIVLATDDTIYYRRVRSNSCSNKKKGRNREFRQRWRAISLYLSIYFKKPSQFNFMFFVSRIIATCRHMLNIIR